MKNCPIYLHSIIITKHHMYVNCNSKTGQINCHITTSCNLAQIWPGYLNTIFIQWFTDSLQPVNKKTLLHSAAVSLFAVTSWLAIFRQLINPYLHFALYDSIIYVGWWDNYWVWLVIWTILDNDAALIYPLLSRDLARTSPNSSISRRKLCAMWKGCRTNSKRSWREPVISCHNSPYVEWMWSTYRLNSYKCRIHSPIHVATRAIPVHYSYRKRTNINKNSANLQLIENHMYHKVYFMSGY